MVVIFPKLCLWRRSLCSNVGGIDPEKLYRATLSGQLRFYHLYLYFVLSAADNEGSRYFSEETNGPFRSNTWGAPQLTGKP